VKIVASVIVRNELHRYLDLFARHLTGAVDEIRVLDDYSTDGSGKFMADKGASVLTNDGPTFDEHEGAARQRLLRHTMESEADWILAIDADEFVGDPARLRAAAEAAPASVPSLMLTMTEVWRADTEAIFVRTDGGWRERSCPILYRVPTSPSRRRAWRIQHKALACGREPTEVRRAYGRAIKSGTSVLHLGWARTSERQARYDRYVELDGGRYHASDHIKSIMAPPHKIRTTKQRWPEGLTALGPEIAARAAR
jgi:glycosyltransferase involved in cell wall biosynthesis